MLFITYLIIQASFLNMSNEREQKNEQPPNSEEDQLLRGSDNTVSIPKVEWQQRGKRWLKEIVDENLFKHIAAALQNFNRSADLVKGLNAAMQAGIEAAETQRQGTNAVKQKMTEVFKTYLAGQDQIDSVFTQVGICTDAIQEIQANMQRIVYEQGQVTQLRKEMQEFMICLRSQFPDMPVHVERQGYNPVFQQWILTHNPSLTTEANFRMQIKDALNIGLFEESKDITCAICGEMTKLTVTDYNSFCWQCLEPTKIICGEKCIASFWDQHREECSIHEFWKGEGMCCGVKAEGLPMAVAYSKAKRDSSPSLAILQKRAADQVGTMVPMSSSTSAKKRKISAGNSNSTSSSSALKSPALAGKIVLSDKDVIRRLEEQNVPALEKDVKNRVGLFIGLESMRFSTNCFYIPGQIAQSDDVCPAFDNEAGEEAKFPDECVKRFKCEYLHLFADRTVYPSDSFGNQLVAKEFARYNRVHRNQMRFTCEKQEKAYREKRIWRQYDVEGNLMAKGVFMEKSVPGIGKAQNANKSASGPKQGKRKAQAAKQPNN